MKALGFLTFALLLLGFAGEASAQTRVGTFRDWSTYTHQDANGKICFAATQPRETLPTNVNRDPVFFFVSTRPGEQVREEPSVKIGYPFAPESKVNITIGDQSFVLMTLEDSAWVENPALEAALVTAMRAGQTMVIRGTSRRGTNTTDTYSLLGITAALNSVSTECPSPGATPPA
jgi:hypothetical protein